ncbi:fatty acyl-CoA reductase [Salix suchowensis]|nr:fatty acyl-CoA reductase [Salix suchowensis]
MDQESSPPCAGVGIVEFLQGKSYFITGATGFLGKALVEKMLRGVPEVGRLFLLIKGKDKEAAMKRLKSEIINAEVFKSLKAIHGNSYEAFMISKLVPVCGDVCSENLGIDAQTTNEIAKEIDVIINSAAQTTWDARYDVAININTKGPARVLEFGKKCNKLRLFLHVSTAYVNGTRQGVFYEKPFCLDRRSTRRDTITSKAQEISVPFLDIDAEIKLASVAAESISKNADQIMRELGTERARIHGWFSTYEMTKAMGEMLIDSMRSSIPTVIIRPSFIESTYREPFPGWIQGYKVPILAAYGQSQLPWFVGDPNTIVDSVPMDMVVNATLAALAKHGIDGNPELNVYHVATSVANPHSFKDVFNYAYDYFSSSPLLDSKGKKISIRPMEFLVSVDSFTDLIKNEVAQRSGLAPAGDNVSESDPKQYLRMQLACLKTVHRFLRIANSYKAYMFYKGRFDVTNTKKLIEDMSIEDRKKFNFDVESINWEHYIKSVHIPGVRKHLLRQTPAHAKL